MKYHILQLTTNLLVLAAMSASAEIRYVNVNSASPTPPYTNWTTAATTIQDAVDVAVVGDQIVVTNGVYQTGGRAVDGTMTNRLVVTKPVTMRSMNGPELTVIAGYQVPGTKNGDSAVRCVYLGDGATLVGFTLMQGGTVCPDDFCFSDGLSSGGGVFCLSVSASISNCVISLNSATYGGGAYGGTLNNCTLTDNSAREGGGASGGTLNNCTLTGNSARDAGGGAESGTLNNCTLSGNSANANGGGTANCTLNNCMLTGNSATHGGGANHSTLFNCTLTGNSARVGGGTYGGTLNNCTLTGNSANSGGGAAGAVEFLGTVFCRLYNCIAYFNTATDTEIPSFGISGWSEVS